MMNRYRPSSNDVTISENALKTEHEVIRKICDWLGVVPCCVLKRVHLDCSSSLHSHPVPFISRLPRSPGKTKINILYPRCKFIISYIVAVLAAKTWNSNCLQLPGNLGSLVGETLLQKRQGRGFESHPSNMPMIFVHRTRESTEYTMLTHIGV